MTIPRCDRNILLVEGVEEKFLIPELIEQAGNIPWGDYKKKLHPVEMRMCGGVVNLLDRDRVAAILKTPNLESVGVVVDANGNLAARWEQVRDRFNASFPSLAHQMPATGLIEVNAVGLRLGIWSMPDNQSEGMLETLLQRLIPQNQLPLLDHAKTAAATARAKGAQFSESHGIKAEMHTWLAWQEPPGLQLHEAVMAKVLDPQSASAKAFVDWFIELFQLHDLRRPAPT